MSIDNLIGKLNFSAGAEETGLCCRDQQVQSRVRQRRVHTRMKKRKADDKLAEMELTDPKRVKR
jgi:hypothetical protein